MLVVTLSLPLYPQSCTFSELFLNGSCLLVDTGRIIFVRIQRKVKFDTNKSECGENECVERV